MNDEWCFRLSRYSKFLFRRWLTSMFTSVSFWKIAAMLVQSLTTFRRGGWGGSSLILCTHRDSVSKMALLWVFLFRPWLTIFLFWNIALTFKLRQVPPRYSGLQSLLSCPHGVVIQARWERMAWRNWYDQRWEGWNGGKGMHSNFEKSPPVTVVSSPCFPVNTENCDSCAVGEDGMEELVWWTMRRMEWWKKHARCEALLVRNCDCASR